jgi:hypothetical protein
VGTAGRGEVRKSGNCRKREVRKNGNCRKRGSEEEWELPEEGK